MSSDLLADLRTQANIAGGVKAEEVHSSLAGLLVQQHPVFKKIFVDESIASSQYDKLECNVAKMRELGSERELSLLPSKTMRLKHEIYEVESSCIKSIKHIRHLLANLELSSVEECEGPQTFKILRENLATRLQLRIKNVSSEIFLLRESRSTLESVQLSRLVGFAFPDATKDDVQEAMSFPELAEQALERKIHDDANCPPLGVVVTELGQSKMGMQRRLEAESMDLELLFFQFNELVVSTDGKLDAIEQNIMETLESTEEAIITLREARDLKVGNIWRRYMFYIIGLIAFFFFVWPWIRACASAVIGYFGSATTTTTTTLIQTTTMAQESGELEAGTNADGRLHDLIAGLPAKLRPVPAMVQLTITDTAAAVRRKHHDSQIRKRRLSSTKLQHAG